MNDLLFKQLSPLEKVFLDDSFEKFEEHNEITALKGERVSYQILYTGEKDIWLDYTIKADEKFLLDVRKVDSVPVRLSCDGVYDEWYLRTAPGLYPDLLSQISENHLHIVRGNCNCLFVTVHVPEDIDAGKYYVEFEAKSGEEKVWLKFGIDVLNGVIPEQDLIYTQWFHADCIASYYNQEIFSKEHWNMIDKFMKMAVYTGINMLLTPIFTLPLDTEEGRERPTLQLIDVKYVDGRYTFGFDRLEKWIDMAQKNGIKYFEMSHLFSQWGTGCTPKIEVETENGTEKMFGWHTKAMSEEYKIFLGAMLPELIGFLMKKKVYNNTYFHISDEPEYEKDFEIYKQEMALITEFVPAEKITDAMSHIEFCDMGIVKKPVVITRNVIDFINKGYKDSWAYYCGGPRDDGYGNRMIAMPSGRNRILGIQLYKYDIKGFLHWGYNFYYSRLSKGEINPFFDTDAGEGFPAGDSFTVYPGKNGPLESLRSVAFYEGIQDYSACRLLESYIGKEEVNKIIDCDMDITFNEYPRTDKGVMGIRERINKELRKYL